MRVRLVLGRFFRDITTTDRPLALLKKSTFIFSENSNLNFLNHHTFTTLTYKQIQINNKKVKINFY